MNRLQKEVGSFADDRPVIKEWQTPLRVIRLLFIELTELMDALIESKDEEIASELADLGFLLYTLSNMLVVDLDDAIDRKMKRNTKKFPIDKFQQGDYNEIMPKARRDWDSNKDKEYMGDITVGA